jgi:deoxycytidylate deaminase
MNKYSCLLDQMTLKASKTNNTMNKHIAVIYKSGCSTPIPIIFGENYLCCNKGCVHNFMNQVKHAEMDALERLHKNPKMKKNIKLNMLVARIRSDHTFGMSRPCLLCTRAIMNSKLRIKKIKYTDDMGNIITEDIKSLLNEDKIHISKGYRLHLVMRGILSDDMFSQDGFEQEHDLKRVKTLLFER